MEEILEEKCEILEDLKIRVKVTRKGVVCRTAETQYNVNSIYPTTGCLECTRCPVNYKN